MKLDQILIKETMNISPLPDWVAEEFDRIGQQQRGIPERFMLQLQQKMGGGVMSYAIEHSGDLIHRLTHNTTHDYYGFDELNEKVRRLKGLFQLSGRASFENEFYDNLRSNARFNNIDDVDGFIAEIENDLEKYATLHMREYPVYNKIQYICQNIPFFIGMRNYHLAKSNLSELETMIRSKELLQLHATQYRLDDSGYLKEYSR